MKKLFMFATAALLVGGVTFAHDPSKGKTKKTCKKGDSCCKKKDKTAKM